MAITPEAFAQTALKMPEAMQASHMGTTDFRVAKRIFATLKPDEGRAVLKLAPDQQSLLIETHPGSATPVKGSWGEKGWTLIHLDQMNLDVLSHWMQSAWFVTASPKLQKLYPEMGGGN